MSKLDRVCFAGPAGGVVLQAVRPSQSKAHVERQLDGVAGGVGSGDRFHTGLAVVRMMPTPLLCDAAQSKKRE